MNPDKKVVILDLDETIINSAEKDSFNFKKYKDKVEEFKYHDMDGYYLVFERPELQEFLDFLFENFNVSVWTAATKDYAKFIVDKSILTKKNRNLDHLFFSYHCDYCKKLNNGTKDLDMLWEHYNLPGYSKDSTILIDDYNKVYKTNVKNKKQPNNCFKIVPFVFKKKSSENDNELNKIKEYLVNWNNNL